MRNKYLDVNIEEGRIVIIINCKIIRKEEKDEFQGK